jgi:archaellum component FlaC
LLNLQNILNKDRDNYNNIIKQIQDQKQTVDKLKNNLLDLKKSLGVLPMEISTLKNQINTYDTSINRTSYLC